MTSFLLIISFLLHIIALYAIVQLYWKVKALNQPNTAEVTELFETYLQEIKEENDRLHELLESHQVNHINTSTQKKEKMGEKRINSPIPEPPPIENKENSDSLEASLEAKVLQLHQQGLSITDIAKRLHCGETEAALIIKLHKK
ncbi:DUF6115 domain-containing protein [Oceanobacillus piezotolerans]|nr:hypothetical protein [Oceanobacillus piezotolerans]